MHFILFPYHDSISNHNFFFRKVEKQEKLYTIYKITLFITTGQRSSAATGNRTSHQH